MGIVALAESERGNFDDVVEAAKSESQIRLGVMSQRLADISYLLGKAHDADFNIISFTGGRAVMNALNADGVDNGWNVGI